MKRATADKEKIMKRLAADKQIYNSAQSGQLLLKRLSAHDFPISSLMISWPLHFSPEKKQGKVDHLSELLPHSIVDL